MWKIVFLCAVHVLPLTAAGPFMNSFMGPFHVAFQKLERCPGRIGQQHIVDLDPLHLTRDRRNKYAWWYNGVASIGIDFTDDLYVLASAASWSSRGGWTPNAFTGAVDRLCSIVKYGAQYVPGDIKQNISAAAGLSIDDIVCPVSKVNFTVKDLYLDFDRIPENMPYLIPYGKYRVEVKAARNKSSPMEFCIRSYTDITPNPGGKIGKVPSNFNASVLSSVSHGSQSGSIIHPG